MARIVVSQFISIDGVMEAPGGKQTLVGGILGIRSPTLVQTLKRHDLVDEYRLMVFPVILGSGMRLFDEVPDATTLRLVGSQSLESGTVILTYRPAALGAPT